MNLDGEVCQSPDLKSNPRAERRESHTLALAGAATFAGEPAARGLVFRRQRAGKELVWPVFAELRFPRRAASAHLGGGPHATVALHFGSARCRLAPRTAQRPPRPPASPSPLVLQVPGSPLVTTVVLTHNRRAELAGCLESLFDGDHGGSDTRADGGPEVVVVDNGSTDGTPQFVRQRYPQVRLVALPENLGVSGGRNRGIQAAQGEICLCIDDDARLVGGTAAIERVAAYFRRDPRLACLALTIHAGRSGQQDPKAIPRRDKRALDEDYECSYFCGAGFAVRRQVFLDAGQFWEPLVYGSQELDLSYRLLQADWRIWHTAAVVVEHDEIPRDRPQGQYAYFNARDRLWVAVRNLPWPCVVTTALAWWLETARWAAAQGQWGPWCRGFRDALAGLPAALRLRRPITWQTGRRLNQLSGRLWY